MSYEILESARAALVKYLDTELSAIQSDRPEAERNHIGDNVFPSKVLAASRLTTEVEGQKALFALAFFMKDDEDGPCGRTNGVVVIDIVSLEDNKKVMWEVLRAAKKAVHCRRMQEAADSQNLRIVVSLFKQVTAEDSGQDPEVQAYVLHSEWTAKYVRTDTQVATA